MKICLVHEEYPDETNFGGIATYQKILAESLVKNGHKVYVIARGLNTDSIENINDVIIYRVYVDNFYSKSGTIKYRKQVAKILKELQLNKKIDIIETPDWSATTVLFEKIRRVPLIVRLHTPLKIWLEYNQNNFGKTKKTILKWENKMIKSASTITSCSNILKTKVIDYYNLNKDNIIVFPNLANVKDFYYDQSIKKKNIILYVGSLEERKGVIIFANALNMVLDKRKDLKVLFIGKDTNRNSKNISTKKYIYEIINKKHHKKIEFLGQIPNCELNKYFNQSRVAVFPSLFDNFPYVVLEAMSTGIEVVGSKNSGMVDMLDNNDAIYNTGDINNLIEKIILNYDKALKSECNKKYINRVFECYDSNKKIDEVVNIYKKVISNYYINDTLQSVINRYQKSIKIKKIKKLKNSVANNVYYIKSIDNRCFIIKQYLYEYDFEAAKELYNIYNKSGIDFIRPLNNKLIEYNGFKYNVFAYKKETRHKNKLDIEYASCLIKCNRKTDAPETLYKKCFKYYSYLLKCESIFDKKIKYVLDTFKKLKTNKLFKEQFLNHGDISNNNILISNKNSYIIDFDEAIITTALYDFAIIIVKNFVKDSKMIKNEYNDFKDSISEEYKNYTEDDYINIIKIYLCKLLMEKFYLHEKGNINLFSKKQKMDDFNKYFELLKNVQEGKFYE